MDLTDRDALRAALRLAGIHPDKKLDQHFLVDRAALEHIITAADLQPTDTVLEIGPGPGVLTAELARRVQRVVAIELDVKFAAIVQAAGLGNVTVVQQDFRRFDLNSLPAGYKVVANLPYGITSLVLRRLLEARQRPASITVLVQKEVAERITARAGQMSLLALSVQYFAEPKIIATVPKTSFYPPPAVDSAIARLTVRPRPAFAADQAKLFRLWKISFAARRKTLKNNLAAGLQQPVSKIDKALLTAGIPLTARAQELSLTDWQSLYQALAR